MTQAPPQTSTQNAAPLRYMDREGNRWTLKDVQPFFVPHFIQAVRVEDGVPVVVHRSDFQRCYPG